MTLSKKPSCLVPQQVPSFVHEYGPAFVSFLQAYYEWMEQTNNPIHLNLSIADHIDVDRTTEQFLEYFHNTYMAELPRTIAADRRLVMKHIREQLYRARGTERGYKFLFRILFDEDVEFYYPGKDILRASDGKWQVDKSLKTTIIYVDPKELFKTKAKVIRGDISGALALVEDITETVVSGVTSYELFLNLIRGSFENNEFVFHNETDQLLFKNELYTVYPGRWLNTDGFLSSDKYLQDNFFYQEFSYVLKVGQSFNKYEKIIKNLMHPAGTKVFGQFSSRSVLEKTQLQISSENAEDRDGFGLSQEGLGLDDANGFVVAIEADPESYTFGPEIDGNTHVANNDIIGAYQSQLIGLYDGWTIGHFTNGKGWWGEGTTYSVDLFPGAYLIVRDASEEDPFLSFHTVDRVNSNTIFSTNQPYPYGDLNAGKIRVGTPI